MMKNSMLIKWLWIWHVIAGHVTLPVVLVLSLTGAIYLSKADYESRIYDGVLVVEAQAAPLSSDSSLPPTATIIQEHSMTRATGDFQVTIISEHQDEATGLNRMALAKTLTGDFVGESTGTMLTAMGDPSTSGTYVAVERMTGTLHGRKGSFVLAHKATMTAAGENQNITIAPDTGTDELKGISGSVEILRQDGQHSYVLDYELP